MQDNKNKSIEDFLAQFKDMGNNQSAKKKTEICEPFSNLSQEFDKLVNEEITNQLSFTVRGFNHYIQFLNCSREVTEMFYKAIKEMKRLPASTHFHGAYDGGLFDHTLLVTNYADKFSSIIKTKIDLRQAIKTAIYHDFGKITYYAPKKGLKDCAITVSPEEKSSMRVEIAQTFGLEGFDNHIEESLAILKKYKFEYNEEICRAILFHHGPWSYYKPSASNVLGALIHAADMVASQILNI